MATIQRPTKEGSVLTYQEKVGLGFVDILASEMDADLDTIYAAWNGGVDSVTLKDLAVTTPKLVDGAVTTAKLADPPNGVTTAKLPALAVTTAKLAVGASVPVVSSVGLPGAVNLTASEQQIVRLPNVTTRGGLVLFVAALTGTVNLPDTVQSTIVLRFYAGSTLVASISMTAVGVTGVVGSYLPVTYSWLTPWTSTVGTNNLDLRGLRTAGNATWQISFGTVFAFEHA
jgi:hypothetical protein